MLAADYHGSATSGVASSSKALDFTSNTAQPGNPGPLASALAQPNLGFGVVTSFVASIWFKPQTFQAAQTTIGPRLFIVGTNGIGDDGAANSIALKYQNPNRMHFRIGTANPTVNIVFPANVPTNVWLFIAAVYNGTNATIYYGTEGTEARAIATGGTAGAAVDFGTLGSLMIGNRSNNRQRSFDGLIDEFRFYTGVGDATFVESIRQATAPLLISNLSPTPFGYDFKLMQASNTLSFTASSTDGINPSGVELVLNGNDVSAGLNVTGSETSRTVAYPNLQLNTVYNGYLRVSNTNGVTGGAWVYFDTFSPIISVESEDYDFDSGMFLDGPQTNAYFGLLAGLEVDVHDIGLNGAHIYRFADPTGTEITGDLLRPQYIGTNDYNLGNFDNNEWINYTRTVPAGSYNVFLRVARGDPGPTTPSFSLVTSGWGTTTQTTTNLGTFPVTGMADGQWQTYLWTGLRDGGGNLVKFNVGTTGTNTMRITSAGANNENFFIVVAANTNLPIITQIYPDGAVQFQPTNTFAFTASSVGGIPVTGVRVTFTVNSLTGNFTTNIASTNGLVVSGPTTSRTVTYAGLIQNARYTAAITVVDANNNTATSTVNFDTYNPAFTWEAEDYDHTGGMFIDNPQTNAYAGLSGTAEIDYHDGAITPQAQAYRSSGDTMATEPNGDSARRPYVGSGLTDYNVGWFDGGDWVNFTRTFPAGDYNVLARVANGQATANGSVSLGRVTNGWGTTTQTVAPLGNITIPPTGGWQTYTWLPFRDIGGNLVRLTTGGTNTLRVTSGGGLNANYFMFVPANTNLPTITQLYPDGNALFQSTNRLTFTASSAAGINTNSIAVTLNGVGIALSNLTFTGSATSWVVSYSRLQPNANYTAVITITDLNGNVATTTVRFSTFAAGYYTWEAEDYDYGSGLFIDNPQTNAYYGLIGTATVDFFESFANTPQLLYRINDTMGTATSGDLVRPQYVGTNDYHIGWFTAGEWVNLTRTFPAGRYHVYVRVARGADGNAEPAFAQVTSGWGTDTQTTNHLGTFLVEPTGGWQTYVWSALRDGSGNLVALNLDGSTNTFRLTSAGPLGNTEVNVNFFMLVPPLTLNASRNGNNVDLSFLTQPGFNYQIQYKNDLGDPTWI